MSHRKEQVSQMIAHLAGDFFARESNGQSIMTVTRADISPDMKNVLIFFTVLPTSFETPALQFAKRSRSDFRDFLKKKTALHPLPVVDFEIDYGEKNRQRIDDLTRS
ncbi:MAG: ribosome-binding factor A [Candidatus Kaiserbacteria bacterium]|nr:ribosome-binding factor A [Candidatus Kaiserbacteria bacterium]